MKFYDYFKNYFDGTIKMTCELCKKEMTLEKSGKIIIHCEHTILRPKDSLIRILCCENCYENFTTIPKLKTRLKQWKK